METNHPNVLFILADDLDWGDVGYHGSEIRTPNAEAPPELYPIDVDPYETSDLANSHPEVVGCLSALIDEEKNLDGTSERPDAG